MRAARLGQDRRPDQPRRHRPDATAALPGQGEPRPGRRLARLAARLPRDRPFPRRGAGRAVRGRRPHRHDRQPAADRRDVHPGGPPRALPGRAGKLAQGRRRGLDRSGDRGRSVAACPKGLAGREPSHPLLRVGDPPLQPADDRAGDRGRGAGAPPPGASGGGRRRRAGLARGALPGGGRHRHAGRSSTPIGSTCRISSARSSTAPRLSTCPKSRPPRDGWRS